MKKQILVIGANSAFAQAVIPILNHENTVVTAGRSGCDVYCDLAKKVKIPSDIDIVINFAASFGGTSEQEIFEAYEVNVLGDLRVCAAAKKAKVKHLINISSVFALASEGEPNYSTYSITKKHGDELIDYYCRLNDLTLTILRPSRIYGDSDVFAGNQPFFYQIINDAQTGKDINIYGRNDARRNYVHVADLAEVIRLVINKKITGSFNCAFPTDTSYSKLASTAQRVFNKGGKIEFLKDKPDILDDALLDEHSLYNKIDFRPQVSIEEGLKRIKQFRQRSLG